MISFKMKNNLIVCILLIIQNYSFLPSFASENCLPSVLSEKYELTIKNGERRKDRKTVDDIEIAKVQWMPDLEKNRVYFDDYDLSKLELSIRRNDGEWEVFKPRKKVVYLGHYTWNVPRIPCLKYDYQIKVPSKSRNEEFFCSYIKSKSPEDEETIRNSGFKPLHPSSVEINAGSKQVTFQWGKSYCAEEYDVYVAETKQEDYQHKSVLQDENSEKANVSFSGLKSCTNYLVEIYSKVSGGETRDEYLQEKLYTEPNSNSASFLDLSDVVSNTSSVSLSFFTWMDQVNCLNNFTIETCKISNCFQRKMLDSAVAHEEKVYSSNGLDHCTKYSIRVQPNYKEIQIKPINVMVITKLDKTAEKSNPHFKPRETNVKIIVKNIECFESYKMRYQLVDSNNNDFEEVQIQNDGNPISVLNLQPNKTYMMNMTALAPQDRQEYPIFELQKFKTLPKTLKTSETSNIHTNQNSKENSTDENRNRTPRHYSENSSKQNAAVMQSIFGITLILIVH